MQPTVPVKALILSGGGARGAYEAGVVSRLLETESFDIVCGTSIGALNGMAVAQGVGHRLPELWEALAARNVARVRPELDVLVKLWTELRKIASRPLAEKAAHLLHAAGALPHLGGVRHLHELRGILDSRHVRAFVEEFADFAAVRTTFVVGVTNLSTARGNAFAYFPPGNDEAAAAFFETERDAHLITASNYVDAVCASAALPPAFEPLPILCADGVTRIFADGGFTNNAPIRQAIDAGATEVTAIFVDPTVKSESDHEVATIAHVASLMLEANTSRMLELDLKLATRINADVLAGAAPGKRCVPIRIIGPDRPILLPVLKFDDFAEISLLMELGRRDAGRCCSGS
jgi:NTE family protein